MCLPHRDTNSEEYLQNFLLENLNISELANFPKNIKNVRVLPRPLLSILNM